MKLLIKNELIKIRRQTAFKVITIIFAVITALIPLGSILLTKAENYLENINDDLEWYSEYADECLAGGDYAGYASYISYSECFEIFSAENKSRESCEYFLFADELRSEILRRDSVGLLLSGKYGTLYDIAEADYGLEYGIADLFAECFPEIAKTAGYSDENPEWKSMAPFLTKEMLQVMLTKSSSEIDRIRGEIRNFDISKYYREDLGKQKTTDEELRTRLSILKESLGTAADTEKAALKYRIAVGEKTVSVMDEILKAKQFLLDNSSEFNGWEYTTVNRLIIPALESLPQLEDMPEEVYADNPRPRGLLSDEIMSYEEYLEENKASRESARLAADMGFDSIESGIPLKKALSYSPKSRWQSQITTVGSLCTIIMIVLAGTTMSSEYSSGSVRLLLIRPRKREKILASKIIAMAIYWGILMFSAYVLLFLLNLVGGVGDIFKPDIAVAGRRIIHINSFLSSLLIMLEDMLGASVFISFALLLSLVIRKAAISIAIPIIARDAASSVQYGCIMLRSLFGKWVTWLPFSYSELSYFRADPTSDYLFGSGGLADLINQILSYGVIRDFKPWYGIICAAVITAVYIVLCRTSFVKQQIKN